MKKFLKIAVTGASGNIGQLLCQHLCNCGHDVVRMQRTTSSQFNTVKYELGQELADSIFGDLDALVHCAYQPLVSSHDQDVNVVGTTKLWQKCQESNVKFVFLSSLAAHDKARSRYGRQKLAIESMLAGSKALVLKPGLVISSGGVFGAIVEIMKALPLVPLIGGGRQPMQTIHWQDLCKIITVGLQEDVSGQFVAAEMPATQVKDIYKTICLTLGLKRLFIPVPTSLMFWAAKCFEALSIPIGINTENLLGLRYAKAFDNGALISTFKIEISPHSESVKEFLTSSDH